MSRSRIIQFFCILVVFAMIFCSCTLFTGTETSSETTSNPTEESSESTSESSQASSEESSEATESSSAESTQITYTVTVVDEDGNALHGATVQLCVGDICKMPELTGEDGVATFNFDEAEYTVKVTLSGYTGEASYTFPAGSTSLTVVLTGEESDPVVNPVPGESAEDPILVDFAWDDAGIEATATVTVPAGKTVYFGQHRIGGMMLTINDGEAVLLESAGMWAPTTFSITNDGAADAEYTLTLTYPLGTMMNPEILYRPAYIAVNLEAGNNQGYFYKWTSNSDGTLVITCPEIDGVSYDVIINNNTSYANRTLVADGEDGAVSIDVSIGDEIIIQVVAVPDAEWNYPAVETALQGALVFAEGTFENPTVVDNDSIGWVDIILAEGDFDGYFYSYTAPADGTLTLCLYGGPEDITADIIVTNSMSVQKTLLADGIDNYGLELTVEVTEGEVIIIQVAVMPVEGAVSAAEFGWGAWFAEPLGTVNNPIAPELEWNDDYTEGTATITVPVGTTYYVIYEDGVMLVINGGEPILLDGAFTITNDGETEAEYTLEVYYPAGHMMNPIVLESIEDVLSVNVAANTTVYYKWYATSEGLISLTTTNALASITLSNRTQYIYGMANNGAGTYYVPAAYGDEIVFAISTIFDDETLSSPEGVIDAAIAVEAPQLVMSSEVELNIVPGKPAMISGYWGGMILTLENASNITVYYNGGEYWDDNFDGIITLEIAPAMGRMPITLTIVNGGFETADCALSFEYPVGSMMNPESIMRPAYIPVNLPEGATDGYYYKWYANADGTLVITCPTVDGVVYDVIINNNNSYANRTLLADGENGTVSIEVKAGDEIVIQVIAPNEDYSFPALETALQGTFVFPVGSRENPAVIENLGNITANVSAGSTEGYFYTWIADQNGTLTIYCPEIEGVNYDVVVTNLRTYAVRSLMADAANGYISINVKTDDEISIQVVGVPAALGEDAPAVQATISAACNFSMYGNDIVVLDQTKTLSATRDDEGNLVLTGIPANFTDPADAYVKILENANISNRYLAIVYKTTDADFHCVYMQGIAKDGSAIEWKYCMVNTNKSGEWAVAVVDIWEVLGENATLTILRFDVCENASKQQSITIKGVEFGDSAEELFLKLDSPTWGGQGANITIDSGALLNCTVDRNEDGTLLVTNVGTGTADINITFMNRGGKTSLQPLQAGNYLVLRVRAENKNSTIQNIYLSSNVANTGYVNLSSVSIHSTPNEWVTVIVQLDTAINAKLTDGKTWSIDDGLNVIRIDCVEGAEGAGDRKITIDTVAVYCTLDQALEVAQENDHIITKGFELPAAN